MSNLTETKSNLKVLTLKEFAAKKAFVQIVPVVRVNTSGYPYVTFVDAKNVAENIYFSKAASKAVAAGTPVDKAMLTVYQIGITTNAAGEERIKLITNSERVDISSLLD